MSQPEPFPRKGVAWKDPAERLAQSTLLDLSMQRCSP